MADVQQINLALVAWGALTSLVTAFGAVAGFLLKGWMKNTTEDINLLKDRADKMLAEEAKCKLGVAVDFMRKKDCQETRDKINETMIRVFDRVDKMIEKMDKQHSQVMYELGVRNGVEKVKKDGK